MTKLRLKRVFWIGTAAILVAATLVALVAVVRGEFSDADARILVTLAALLYTGGTALAGLALVDRGLARSLGWLVVVAAPICLAFILTGVWSFVDEGTNENEVKLAWTGVLALLAGLLAATALLLARTRRLVLLARLAGSLAGLAAAISVVGIWTGTSSDAFVKALAVVWILGALCYFLVPVLQRFTAAGAVPPAIRVLATLDGVELVASRGPLEGVAADTPSVDERLVLRRRAAGR